MEISFASRKLQAACSDMNELRKAFGDMARTIKLRLDVLYEAACLADVPHTPPTRRHALSSDWKGHFAVDVSKNWRLIFRPTIEPVPDDLRKITAITIAHIGDYH